MLYPVLHRLESRALVECYWKTSPSGRKRKYYSITSAGRAELKDKQATVARRRRCPGRKLWQSAV